MFWYIAGPLIVIGLLLYIAVKWSEWATAKEKIKFQLPLEGERLLGFGALMLTVDDRTTYIVRLSDCDKETKRIAEWWGVTSSKAAKETIQWLLISGARRGSDAGFAALQRGACFSEIKGLNADGYLRAKDMKHQWVAAGLAPEALGVTSLAAFDIERAAWLARVSHKLGYLTDAELWRVMKLAAEFATKRFTSWSEYGASFILGHAVLQEEDVDYLAAAKLLLCEEEVMIKQPRIWQLHAWQSIDPASEFLQTFAQTKRSAEEGDPQVAHVGVLAFGALLNWNFHAFATRLRCDQNIDGDRRWLADSYGICDAQSADASLDELLAQGVHEELDATMAKDAQGLTALKQNDAAAYLRATEVLGELEKAGFSTQSSKGKLTVLAYDLERAAYISRIVLPLGYADEPTTLKRLRRIAVQAHMHFDSWEEYLVSFLLGAAICSESSQSALELMSVGSNLLRFQSPFENYDSPWQAHPFRKSGMLHSVQ